MSILRVMELRSGEINDSLTGEAILTVSHDCKTPGLQAESRAPHCPVSRNLAQAWGQTQPRVRPGMGLWNNMQYPTSKLNVQVQKRLAQLLAQERGAGTTWST